MPASTAWICWAPRQGCRFFPRACFVPDRVDMKPSTSLCRSSHTAKSGFIISSLARSKERSRSCCLRNHSKSSRCSTRSTLPPPRAKKCGWVDTRPGSLRRRIEREPFVSIHVPAHNEPPELLMQTLRSLSRIHWSNYEVLVIDNNTADPLLWRPVEAFCRELGPRFRFFHVENLKGFKAG